MNAVDVAPPEAAEADKRTRVLVIDDDPTVVWALSALLEDEGLSITNSENGSRGIAEFNETGVHGPYALIVMDMQMPVMDGFTATMKLRRQGVTVPIIAFTSLQESAEIERAMSSGCTAHLAKPATPTTVRKVLLALVAQGHLPSQRIKAPPLRSTREDDTSLAPLLAKYRQRLSDMAENVEALLFSGDFIEIAGCAHKVKGTAATYGFPTLGDAAATCENQIRTNTGNAIMRESVVHFHRQLRDVGSNAGA